MTNILTALRSTWNEIATRYAYFPVVREQFFTEGIEGNDFSILPIGIQHATVLATLPMHYKDPFDRMIVAQSIAESVPVLSIDAAFDPYGVTRLW